MEEIIRKAMRIKKPRYVSVQLRSEVYEFLVEYATKLHCSTAVLCRGVLEDFFDLHVKEVFGQDE